MSRFTLDSASEFLFGRCTHALSGDLPFPHNVYPKFSSTHRTSTTSAPGSTVLKAARSATEFAHSIHEAQEIVATRDRYGWTWPLTEILSDKSKKSMDVVNAYLAPIIADAIRKRAENEGKEKEEGDEETLIDHLVGLTSGM